MKRVDKQDAHPAVNSIDADEMLKGVLCTQTRSRKTEIIGKNGTPKVLSPTTSTSFS